MLLAPWWCFGLCRASSIEVLRRRGGATYCLVQVCAIGMVLSRAKAFTDGLVGGDGVGALVSSFFLLGAPL